MTIYFILFFQSLISSGTHIVAKVVVTGIEPVTLTMLRSFLAMVGLIVIAAVRRTSFRFRREDYPRILLLSVLAIPINQFLFLSAMRLTSPSNAALLYATTPALVLLFSWTAGRERLTWKKGGGVLIAFCGVLIILFQKGVEFRSDYAVGNLLLVIAVIAWALYTVGGRELILRYGAFPTSAATMIIGTLLFLPIGGFRAARYDFTSIGVAQWGGLLYLSMGTSIFAYFLWYYALSRIQASKVAVFSNLQPILTTVMAVLLLHQEVPFMFIVGGMIAISGVVLAQFG